MRAVATVSFYVYGKDEKELIEQSKKKIALIKTYENYASLDSLHHAPFGKIGEQKQIKL